MNPPFPVILFTLCLHWSKLEAVVTRISLGRRISPFLFWELPLPHSTKIGLNTWGQPGPQTLNTGLLEEISLNLYGGDAPPLGKRIIWMGCREARKHSGLHYAHSWYVVNSDFQKMRIPWTQIFAIFPEIQTIPFFSLETWTKRLTNYRQPINHLHIILINSSSLIPQHLLELGVLSLGGKI